MAKPPEQRRNLWRFNTICFLIGYCDDARCATLSAVRDPKFSLRSPLPPALGRYITLLHKMPLTNPPPTEGN